MATIGEFVGKKTYSRPVPDDIFILPEAKVGVEVEAENVRSIAGLDGSLWQTKPDHSLKDHGLEFVTIDGLIGNQLRKAIVHICELAKKLDYSIGDQRAGIHLHIDVTDLSVEKHELLRLVSNYAIVEHMLFGWCGPWRQHLGYCVPYKFGKSDFITLGKVLMCDKNDDTSKAYGRDAISSLSKYQALNLRPLIDLGTIEFRHLPTTFDADRIIFWSNIALALKKSATDPELSEPLKALSLYGPEIFCQKILTRPIYEQLRPYMSEREIWSAIDSASTIMALGKQSSLTKRLTSYTKKQHSPIVKERIEALMAAKMKNKQLYTVEIPEFLKPQVEDLERRMELDYVELELIPMDIGGYRRLDEWIRLVVPFTAPEPNPRNLVESYLVPKLYERRALREDLEAEDRIEEIELEPANPVPPIRPRTYEYNPIQAGQRLTQMLRETQPQNVPRAAPNTTRRNRP